MDNNDKFKIFSGIRSFARVEGGYISVTDVETKYSVVEEYQHVYDTLKILLNEKQMMYFERVMMYGQPVVFNFLTSKLSFVKDKDFAILEDGLSKELKLSVIEERYLNEDDRKNYFLMV